MDSLARHNEYELGALDVGEVDADPLVQLAAWLGAAEAAGITEPNAMVLGTVADGGRPRSRTVLLRGIVDGSFEFVTDARSRKGADLALDRRASLVFPWYALQRQVLVEGVARPGPARLSDDYWSHRPRGSKVAAWASHQSAPIADRPALEAAFRAADIRFEGVDDIPRPPEWGAWLVAPDRIEFWQGRRSRLHDRVVYDRADGPGAAWAVSRIQP